MMKGRGVGTFGKGTWEEAENRYNVAGKLTLDGGERGIKVPAQEEVKIGSNSPLRFYKCDANWIVFLRGVKIQF